MANKTSVKLENWQGQRLIKIIKEKEDVFLMRIANLTRSNIRSEVPVDSGNLRDATIIEDIGEVDTKRGLNVGTDEDKAPYAPYVYFPAGQHGLGTKTKRKRSYEGNDWITRALNSTLTRVAPIISQTLKELNGIEI